jgi:heme oxygenase
MAHDYDLLVEMRKATRRAHHIANALILSKLVVVLTDKQLYARALGSFYPVYTKLEELIQIHQNVPCLAPVVEVVAKVPRRAAMEQVGLQGCMSLAG